METAQHGRKIFLRLHAIDLCEVGFQRGSAEFVDSGLIHAGREEVTDQLLRRVSAGRLLREVVEDTPEETLIVLIQLAVNAPSGLVGGDRIVLHPSAAGVLVEVDAGVCRLVHRVHIEARGVWERCNGLFVDYLGWLHSSRLCGRRRVLRWIVLGLNPRRGKQKSGSGGKKPLTHSRPPITNWQVYR